MGSAATVAATLLALADGCARRANRYKEKKLQNEQSGRCAILLAIFEYLHRNLHTFTFVGNKANKTKTFSL